MYICLYNYNDCTMRVTLLQGSYLHPFKQRSRSLHKGLPSSICGGRQSTRKTSQVSTAEPPKRFNNVLAYGVLMLLISVLSGAVDLSASTLA